MKNEFFIATFSLFIFSLACTASAVQESSIDSEVNTQLKPSSTYNARDTYDTSLARTSIDRFYCNNHLVETELTLRHDMPAMSQDYFFNAEISVQLNGHEIDLSSQMETINKSEFPVDVAIQYFCVNDQITLSIFLDQGTSVPYNTLIDRINIDLETGDVLDEPRLVPKD